LFLLLLITVEIVVSHRTASATVSGNLKKNFI